MVRYTARENCVFLGRNFHEIPLFVLFQVCSFNGVAINLKSVLFLSTHALPCNCCKKVTSERNENLCAIKQETWSAIWNRTYLKDLKSGTVPVWGFEATPCIRTSFSSIFINFTRFWFAKDFKHGSRSIEEKLHGCSAKWLILNICRDCKELPVKGILKENFDVISKSETSITDESGRIQKYFSNQFLIEFNSRRQTYGLGKFSAHLRKD